MKKARSEPAEGAHSFTNLVSKALEQQARENELQAKRLELEEKRLAMEAQERAQQHAMMMEVLKALTNKPTTAPP